MPLLVKPYLFLSAAVLLLVGALLSFAPEVLYASSGQDLPAAVMIRSDLRAGGMLLLLSGLFVGAATLNLRSARPALQLSALVYLGYGLGRIASLAFDGTPDTTLMAVTGVEWLLGLAAVALLWRGLPADPKQRVQTA